MGILYTLEQKDQQLFSLFSPLKSSTYRINDIAGLRRFYWYLDQKSGTYEHALPGKMIPDFQDQGSF